MQTFSDPYAVSLILGIRVGLIHQVDMQLTMQTTLPSQIPAEIEPEHHALPTIVSPNQM
jgi:hypothetical protein